MNRALGAWLLLIALGLSGCATAVPQAFDRASVPERFVGPATSAGPAWPDAAWWRGFGDPQLTALISQAQANNRDVAVAQARVMQAKAQTAIQRSALLPQIGATAGHTNGGCSGEACQQFTSLRAYNLGFNASYAPDVWGEGRDNLRAADEQLKSARFSQRAVALTVTANVADQYLNVLAIRRRIAIAEDDIAAINGILDVIQLRVKAGATSHLDLAREQAQAESVQAEVPGLRTLEKQSLFSLAVLLGEPPEDLEVKGQDLDAILAPAIGAGLPSELLLRRPDIAQAEADLAAAHANLDAARAAFAPQILLTGSGGFVNGALGALLQGSSFGYGYGASLLQTIFDGGKLRGQKDLATAVQQQFVANYQSVTLNAFADVESSLVAVANTAEAEQHLRHEVDAARQAFAISELQYRQGAGDLLTVLQAQETLFSAEDQLAQTQLANRQAAVSLYQALGGGWIEDPSDRTQLAGAAGAPLTAAR